MLDGLRGRIYGLVRTGVTHPAARDGIAQIERLLAGPMLRPVVLKLAETFGRGRALPTPLAVALAPDTPSPRILAACHAGLAAQSEDQVRAGLSALADLLTQWLIEDDERRGAEAEADEIAEIVRDARLEAARRALLETDLHGPDIPDAAPDTAPDGAA